MMIAAPTDQSAMAPLFATARQLRLAAGEVLFHEGDPSSKVYQCRHGSLRLVVSACHGRELILDVVLPGDVFGELTAIDHRGRSASAIAMEETSVAELDGDEYLRSVRRDPVLSEAAMCGLARQVRRANQRICAGETERLSVRAARLLLELAGRYSRHDHSTGGGIPITQTDLAEWLGASREATARVLSELRGIGAITTARSLITVIDAPRLAFLAAG
jgi:CRP-like cAMP-binding protein